MRFMTVTELFIYPIKSTHRISMAEAEVNPWGLTGDRRWMIVDDTDRFLTQREEPPLALVQGTETPAGLNLTAPGMPSLDVSYPVDRSSEATVVIWKDTVKAVVSSPESCSWFSDYLRRSCRLVYMQNPFARPADTTYARPGSVVSFADGFPLLLTSHASLADLNDRLQEPLPMTRFRPNVVIDGRSSFEEDWWQRIRIGDVIFGVIKPCTRCVITTTDQDTADRRSKEPLRTLSTFRRHGGNVYFGENLVPEFAGTIRIGDEVEVLKRRPRALPEL